MKRTVSNRLRQLADKVSEDFDPTQAALEAFGRLPNPTRLTSKQERLLAFLEIEYNLQYKPKNTF